MEKVKLYLDQINLIASSSIPNKHKNLAEVLTKYYRYCYENNLDANTYLNIFELGPLSYIIESEPLIFDLNEDDVAKAFKHLQEVINNNKNGIPDGITLEEAKLILDWDIQNARKSLARCEKDIKTASLSGTCGLAQGLTLLPLIEANLECTINNVINFPLAKYTHAFGTVKIPIKDENGITYMPFLIDASYRQFFTTTECNQGRYYIQNCTSGPTAGYYVCQTSEGIAFATKLLKNGYIELTPENIKIYGNGFECMSLTLQNAEKQPLYMQTPGIVYLHTIYNNQVELNNDKEELEADGDIIVPPGLEDSRKI